MEKHKFWWLARSNYECRLNRVGSAIFIEYMGTSETWLECNLDPRYTGSDICLRPVYRVTARSEAAGRASVIVQSNFIVP